MLEYETIFKEIMARHIYITMIMSLRNKVRTELEKLKQKN
jgi:hypothetical protein